MTTLSPYSLKSLKDRRLDVLDYLLASGEPVDGDTGVLICTAAAMGYVSAIGLLVKRYDADVNVNNAFAIRIAAEKGHLKTLAALHTLGADIHINNEEVLLRAAYGGRQSIVSYLLAYPCDPNQAKKAYALAKKAGHQGIAAQIKQYLLSLPKETQGLLWHGEWDVTNQLSTLQRYEGHPCRYLIIWQALDTQFVSGHISGYVGYDRFTFKLFYCEFEGEEMIDVGFGKDQLLYENLPRDTEQTLLSNMSDAFFFFMKHIDEVAFLRDDALFLPLDHNLKLTQEDQRLTGGTALPPPWANTLLARAAIPSRPHVSQ